MKSLFQIIVCCILGFGAAITEAGSYSNQTAGTTDNWDQYIAAMSLQVTPPTNIKLAGWGEILKQKREWYATDEAGRIADNILLFQRNNGGWPKNINMAAVLAEREKKVVAAEKPNTDTTIDNGATCTQLALLAKIFTLRNQERHRTAFMKGLDFLFSAQYDNGGFPQFFPLRKDYSRHITYNDGAMTGVMKLFKEIAGKNTDFAFIDDARRMKAEEALKKGIDCILKTQVIVNGRKTVWCAQHDEITFAPAGARKYELPSLSGSESAGVAEFLMSIANPSPQVIESIESAIAWFETTKINGIRWVEDLDKDNPSQFRRYLVRDPNAPPLWARFYQIESNRPIFVGRDGVIKYDVMDIEAERRNGYAWYVEAPGRLLKTIYPAWQNRRPKFVRESEN